MANALHWLPEKNENERELVAFPFPHCKRQTVESIEERELGFHGISKNSVGNS